MMTEHEFACVDCGITVYALMPVGMAHRGLCLECQVIRDAEPEDRPALRKAFHKEEPKEA
jgi:hypothetical protein